MNRGGRRPRRIGPGDASVSCPGGRWGRRRTRVTECYTLIRAEDVYAGLLAQKRAALGPGTRGTAIFTIKDRGVEAGWEVRHNAVWRRGRVFLLCSRCSRRCTRLYLPLADSWLACRRCWGLTYESRTLRNYKDTLWGRGMFARMFGTTQREWALNMTTERRAERIISVRKRWAERQRSG